MKDFIFVVNEYGEDGQISSYSIQEAAVHSIPGCDYTDDLDSEDAVHDEIEGVLSSAEEKGIIHRIDKTGFEFVKDGPEKYFGNRLDLLKKKVCSLSVEEFTTDADLCIFRIRQLMDETLKKYVYLVPYDEIMTLDSFVREYAGNMRYINKENKFSLENIILYHY